MSTAAEYLPNQNYIDREEAIAAIKLAVAEALNEAIQVPGLDDRQINYILIINDELE